MPERTSLNLYHVLNKKDYEWIEEALSKEFDCDHLETEVRLKNGAYWRQCLRCGHSVAIKKTSPEIPPDPKPVDETLQQEYARKRSLRSHELRVLAATPKKNHVTKQSEWWSWYERYLKSPEWRARRAKVLKRSRGICEGCGENQATEVHHLTYERVGNEMLFDLVAVCNSCHNRLHPNRHLRGV